MHVADADTPVLKQWLMKRLEDISDADSDVLADYVLALAKSDDADDGVRASCIENLDDFLKEHTTSFVDDVLKAIKTGSYKPGYIPPKPVNLRSTAPTGLPGAYGQAGNFIPQSRKRSHHDFADDGSQGGRNGVSSQQRASKQMRRTHNGRGNDVNMQYGFNGGPQNFRPSDLGNFMPPPPPGLPPLDPNNPMAAILAMQAMGFTLPPMQEQGLRAEAPAYIPGFSRGRPRSRRRQRCRDYDTTGFCVAGDLCPYEHGEDHIVMGDNEHGAINSQASHSPMSFQSHPRNMFEANPRARGRGNSRRAHQQRQRRASFSSPAPSGSSSTTSIVVERIPPDHLSEEAVLSFFSDFGDVEDIDLMQHRQLAVVKYTDHESAQRAYESPKVIFDNRFVKVYWLKSDKRSLGRSSTTQEDEPPFDPEEFARKSAEAQRTHEVKMKKLAEAAAAKDELDQKIKSQAKERLKLLKKLSSKTGIGGAKLENGSNGDSNGDSTGRTSQTEVLRAKLAELEAEAEALGVSPDDAVASSYPYQDHGYASRGRGFAPRGFGRGRANYRGFGRGRGGWQGGVRAGAVARLDNRPKGISITLVEPDADDGPASFDEETAGEALRAFLMNVGDYESISAPDDTVDNKKVTVSFRERYVADMFVAKVQEGQPGSGPSIPGLGRVELAWVKTQAVAQPAEGDTEVIVGNDEEEGHVNGEMLHQAGSDGEEETSPRENEQEVDYDVADDDDDRWMR